MYFNRLNTRYLIAILILSPIFLIFSCKNSTKDNTKSTKDSLFLTTDTFAVETDNSQLTSFRNFLQQLDSSKAESVSFAIIEFKRTFEGKSAGLCDSAYIVLQEHIDTVELKLNEKIQEDTTDYSAAYIQPKLQGIMDKLEETLKKDGFQFTFSEGMFYIEQDRAFVTKNLLTMFTKPMQAYLIQIEKENREGFTDNAGIEITPRQHVDRIIWYEKFIAENPNFLLLKNCRTYKKAYFTYLLNGIDQTYLFENEKDMKLTPYFVQAYGYLLKTYPDSEAATLVLPYKQAIEQKQKSVVQELLKKYVIKGLIYSQGI